MAYIRSTKVHRLPSSSTPTFLECLIPNIPIRTVNLLEEIIKSHRLICPTIGGTPFFLFFSARELTASPSSNRRIRPIFNLDNDSLLNIFHFYRLLSLESSNDKIHISERVSGGSGGWVREHWWGRLVLVCRKWRYLIFESPSYLRLCIAHTRRVPVATDMLVHPPFLRLPLVIDYNYDGPDNQIPEQDIPMLLWALQHRDRLRRIRLHAPFSQMVFGALVGEFPNLESLHLRIPHARHLDWVPHGMFRTPRLLHLELHNITCPLGSPLLTPAAGLVALSLTAIGDPYKFSPDVLLQLLSLMPKLVTLQIGFTPCSDNPAGEREIMNLRIQTHVHLPYLRRFLFKCTNTYLGAILPHISTPPLDKFQIYISNLTTPNIPSTLGLMSGSENFKSYRVDLMFLDKGVFLRADLLNLATRRTSTISMSLCSEGFTWQVLAAAHYFAVHRACFFLTRHLTIRCRIPASKQQLGPDHRQWRNLFAAFCVVDILQVYDGNCGEISRSFQLNHGESANGLFPSLKQLSVHTGRDHRDTWTQFIEARKRGGRPVALRFTGPGPSAIEVAMRCEVWEAFWLWKSFRLKLDG